MSNAGKRGRFVWYDLMTSDPKAAETFYGKLIAQCLDPQGALFALHSSASSS